MKPHKIQPGKDKVLERKLKDLRRTLRELEGNQERGFFDQSDQLADERRIRAVRKSIAEIEESLDL